MVRAAQIIPDGQGDVAALLRRFYALAYGQQIEAWLKIGSYLNSDPTAPRSDDVRERVEALRLLMEAAEELELPQGAAPTTRAFNNSRAAREAGWNANRVGRIFGRWSFAIECFLGDKTRQSAKQRAAESVARRGVVRGREDYLHGLRMWLDTEPVSQMTADYDAWHCEYNAARQPGDPPVVSYSMLSKAFQVGWTDLLDVARGTLSIEEAEAREPRRELAREEGPHGLIGFAEVRRMLGLGITQARNATRKTGFPAPAYVHTRGPRARLWRRAHVRAFLDGSVVGKPCDLQGDYLDREAVAHVLGLGQITVTTGSSPRVPAPAVRAAGLQLWLRSEVEEAQCEIRPQTQLQVAGSARGESDSGVTQNDPRTDSSGGGTAGG